MSHRSLIVRAPASTSNCGPGFDTLSIALSLYNFVRLGEREDDRIRAVDAKSAGAEAMVAEAAAAFAELTGCVVGGLDIDIWGEVPEARGLGSSATVRASVIAGLNRLHGDPLDREAMIRLTARLDNAADNSCAAFVGGFCIARTESTDGSYREHVRFPLSDALSFVAVAPSYQVLTANSRRVLPDSLPFADVVASANSLAFLVGALVSGDFERLKGAAEDYIHQPYREHLNPFGHESIEAGCHAGAYTGWLSGSGSTVICVAPPDLARVVSAQMQAAYSNNNQESRAYLLTCDNAGLSVGDPEPRTDAPANA